MIWIRLSILYTYLSLLSVGYRPSRGHWCVSLMTIWRIYKGITFCSKDLRVDLAVEKSATTVTGTLVRPVKVRHEHYKTFMTNITANISLNGAYRKQLHPHYCAKAWKYRWLSINGQFWCYVLGLTYLLY